MAKVIVERPRRGSDLTRRGRHPRDSDQLVDHEGMRARHVRHYGGKELNENLAPLLRFLRSRVGQRWDDVYSEISQHLKVTSATQQHVRDHVSDFVAIRCRRVDGVLYDLSYGVRELNGYTMMFVDPDTGILTLNPGYLEGGGEGWREREARARALVWREIETHTFHKVKGIWYEVELAAIPQFVNVTYTNREGERIAHKVKGAAFDVVLKRTVSWGEIMDGRHITWVVSSKRQLNSNELKQRGLSND